MLNPVLDGIYVDATIGLGGHAEQIIKLIGPEGKLVGIDMDEDALRIAGQRLSDKRIILKKGLFSDTETLLKEEGISEVDGVLFDLGISMLHLRNYERGFSFLSDRLLDMRMDKGQNLSAWDIVNNYSEKQIDRILEEFGEERLSKKIARAIVNARRKKKIDTCSQLSNIVSHVYGRRSRLHPATKTFQALRIAVNDELEQLKRGLEVATKILKSGGKICVISYHSLEDRIVKNFISEHSRQGVLRAITKKPITPSHEEIRANPSSRSAKLRAAEKV